mmetsp:Transcript_24290/g.84368  ORF Transcript_24290/g.84368 Transcript_24290/m.84368 type:complete len:254 (-) Transcript_24290:121-882(-)
MGAVVVLEAIRRVVGDGGRRAAAAAHGVVRGDADEVRRAVLQAEVDGEALVARATTGDLRVPVVVAVKRLRRVDLDHVVLHVVAAVVARRVERHRDVRQREAGIDDRLRDERLWRAGGRARRDAAVALATVTRFAVAVAEALRALPQVARSSERERPVADAVHDVRRERVVAVGLGHAGGLAVARDELVAVAVAGGNVADVVDVLVAEVVEHVERRGGCRKHGRRDEGRDNHGRDRHSEAGGRHDERQVTVRR